MRIVVIANNYCSRDFRKLYHFTENNVEWLADYSLGDKIEVRGALSSGQIIQLFLRFQSDPGFQQRSGSEEGIQWTTASKTVTEVLPKIM